ncbi:MAG: discoidin domain-containing protein [Bacteroidetes bacterium]|nr:discoidin domain-containing protein [Bacteroidota bacterium]MBL6944222.1 discoidin domain-containing protein [Bacteroidales bacterium]
MNASLIKVSCAIFLILTLPHFSSCDYQNNKNSVQIDAPKLTNNPSFDVICTNNQPLLSFYNSKGGIGQLSYTIHISSDKDFTDIIAEYDNVVAKNKFITTKLIEENDSLPIDKQYYYWRVKAIDTQSNESNWATSRFFLDTKSNDSFMNLVRVKTETVVVSGGANAKNIIDITDIGNTTHWEPPPPGDSIHWVEFKLIAPAEISRIWMLSNPDSKEGWLTNFYWMYSLDGKNWTKIEGAEITDNDTYRNIIDFAPVTTAYLKLIINNYLGYAPQVYTTIFYSPGIPEPPHIPDKDYVLIVGDQLNGFTFTELAKFVEGLDLNLETVTVPHYEVSLSMVEGLNPQPVAIIFSGNNANYPNLPMYEFNGGFEIVRNSDIPILGICAGHQLQVIAFGYTYAHSTGWFDNTIMDIETDIKPDSIEIVKESPIFKNIPNPFFGVEIHSWATAEEVFPLIRFELLAKSSYVQAQKISGRMVFGEQFHAEVDISSNQGKPMIYNFLSMALIERKKRSN